MNKRSWRCTAAKASTPWAAASDVPANAGVVGLNTALRYAIENASRDLAGNHGPLFETSLLRSSSADGRIHVSRFEDDADTATGPAAAAHDEDHAYHQCGIFMISPISSGLAVYILTSSRGRIAPSSGTLNRTHPLPAPAKDRAWKKS